MSAAIWIRGLLQRDYGVDLSRIRWVQGALKNAGIDPTKPVVTTCGSGVTACHNLLAMEHAGIRGAKLYIGSWSEWSADASRGVEIG